MPTVVYVVHALEGWLFGLSFDEVSVRLIKDVISEQTNRHEFVWPVTFVIVTQWSYS